MANKRISQLPYVGNTGYTSIDIMPIVNYDVPTGTTKHTPIIDFQNWVLSATPITYSSFVTLITNNNLIPGAFYNIINFRTCYDQPDFDDNDNPITTGNYKQGPVEPIMVLATSVNTISEVAYQPLHPFDRITYDWTFSTTEVTNGSAFGRITERIDEYNNRTDYDHRNILFKRYILYTYRDNLSLNGSITIAGGGSVTGLNTDFNNLSVGDVIYVPGSSPGLFYEVTNISSPTSMTISGNTITNGSNLDFYLATQEINPNNNYFGYKKPNVKSNDYVEHTTFGSSISNTYAKNNYIGNHSNNYQNIGSGIFMLSNNLFIYGPCLNNRFENSSFNNTIGDRLENNNFSEYFNTNVFTSLVRDNHVGSYFISNVINFNFYENTISDSFASNRLFGSDKSNFSNNSIGDQFEDNTLYSDFTDNFIGNQFFSNIIGDYFNSNNYFFNKNSIKSNFANNRILTNFFDNKINNKFQKNDIFGSFYNNNIDDSFIANVVGNNIGSNTIKDNFVDNKISDNFNSNSIGIKSNKNYISLNFLSNTINNGFSQNYPIGLENFDFNNLSTLSLRTYEVFEDSLDGQFNDNILGKELVMKVDSVIPNRYFAITFYQWSYNSSGFQYRRQEYDSAGSPIGSQVTFTKKDFDSEIDIIIPGILELTRSNSGGGIYNSAVEGSFNSSLSPSGTNWNSIYTQKGNNGSDFAYNKIGISFVRNEIGNNFGTDARLPLGNSIGDYFNDNKISNNIYGNQIGNYFYNNIIDDNFSFNNIKNYFTNNVLGPNFQGNDIGNYFGCKNDTQIIGGYFQNNHIGNYFGNDGISELGANLIGVVTSVGYSSLKGVPSAISLTNGGSSYSDSSNVPTTGGANTGLSVNITTNGFGVINSISINNPGTYYSVGDIITITTGDNNATFTITDINTFVVGEVIENGLGGSAEVVSDDGVSEMTINLIIDGLSIGNTIDNLSGSSATITGYTVEPSASAFTQNNIIGNYFLNNQIGEYFQNNFIRNYFGNYKTSGISNIILDGFSGNSIANHFGFDLVNDGDGGNIIRDNFAENTIGESFTYNVTVNTTNLGFFNNVIGYGCNRNTITNGFNFNRIGDIFQENILGENFSDNEIGYFFNVNIFGNNAFGNRFGYFCWYNEVGDNFQSNHTEDQFFGNFIGDNFYHNNIGSFCGQFPFFGNTWGSNIFDNQIGEHTILNTIGDNFNNNNIFNEFSQNTVGGNFRFNITQYPVTGIDFTPATHVYNQYNCTIFNDSTGSLKLSFIDGTPSLAVVAPNS